MRKLALILSCALAAAASAAAPPDVPIGPPIWADKPDARAFEALENARLDAAKKSIDAIVSVKGARSIENTLQPFDDANRELDSASYLSALMEEVHPEAAFR